MPNNELIRGMTEEQAAVYLGVSTSTLRHGRCEGFRNGRMSPPPFVRLGRKIVHLRDDLDAWLAQNRCDLSPRKEVRGG